MPRQEVPISKQPSDKIILEARLRAIEVEVSNIRRKIEMLPPHHEVSWVEIRKTVQKIVLDALGENGDSTIS